MIKVSFDDPNLVENVQAIQYLKKTGKFSDEELQELYDEQVRRDKAKAQPIVEDISSALKKFADDRWAELRAKYSDKKNRTCKMCADCYRCTRRGTASIEEWTCDDWILIGTKNNDWLTKGDEK